MSSTISFHQPEYFPKLVREVRNPLCNIMLACDLLKISGLDAEQAKYLDIVNRASVRINQQVDRLLVLVIEN